jgi:DNA-binding MltR family transcriptional regulator
MNRRKKKASRTWSTAAVMLGIRREVDEFYETLQKETDRGLALVCASYLEVEIRRLLRDFLVEAPKVAERLLGISGACGTFSSQIDLALLIGLIHPKVYKGLHLIRRIRNCFAHEHRKRSFTDADIASRCRELCALKLISPVRSPKALFSRICMSMITDINARKYLMQSSGLRIRSPETAFVNMTVFQDRLRTAIEHLSHKERAAMFSRSLSFEKRSKILMNTVDAVSAKMKKSN